MKTRLVRLGLVALVLAGCGSATDTARTLPTVAPAATTSPSTYATSVPDSPPPTNGSNQSTSATTRPNATPEPVPAGSPDPAPSPTGPPATARPELSRTEASTKLCQAIRSANDAVMGGNFVAGGLRLSGGISSYADAADPALVSAARSMLSAGLNGDADGYVSARLTAANVCSSFGVVISTGGVECLTDPCP